jgi:ABC-type multidrug transport system ATPase subunit
MHNKLRGKCIYQAEMDVHFPTLSVRETLEFAMRARNSKPSASPENDRVGGISRGLGLSNVLDTKIGNDLVRGVSGGERKRASIGVGGQLCVCSPG